MPEGVEVKIVATQLAKEIQGKYLRGIWTMPGGRYQDSLPEGLSIVPLPCKILEINCKGKFIYWKLDNDWNLFNTLGMSGSWNIKTKGSHPALKFWISSDDFSKEGYDVFFNDIRHFGTVKFVKGEKELTKKLNSLGPDMLANPPDDQTFITIIKKQGKKNICQVLMDQKIISGLGNYLKAESLYKAGISPWRICDNIPDKVLISLRSAIIDTIQASHKAGGTTIFTFKDMNGHIGNFASQLQVYGKTMDPLGHLVIRETTPDKRTSYWAPDVQL